MSAFFKNPYAGIQHETDECGFPWWEETPTHPVDLEPEVEVCPVCGADAMNGVCTYNGGH